MKRVKLMLMGICLIALAGGILAFKTLSPTPICTVTATTNPLGQPTCSITVAGQQQAIDCAASTTTIFTTVDAAPAFFCYTTQDGVGNPCRNDALGVPLKCPVKATLTLED